MGSSLWGTNVYIASFIILSWISIVFISQVINFTKRVTVASIDCFKCVSMNGRSPQCDDPFHNNHSLNMLESPCMGGRKGRDGLFPATSCIKIAGVFGKTVIY
ncbi:jg22354 [Pararge aegeria aegeria]|uniref:Jg22354 protein n=1 Tax=Pararge aegeria aegeria TaxID=348720 RepID=A0A8S4SD86_9NEOP|nr:jg22354 [Pararge aegeria aegeria]